MKKLFFIFLIIVLPLISCSRVQESARGKLSATKLKKIDAIPIEYGSLAGVTANPKHPSWAQLWFEDADGIIRVVTVGFFAKRIFEDVTVIPRN